MQLYGFNIFKLNLFMIYILNVWPNLVQTDF
jgi:hypothetical protein